MSSKRSKLDHCLKRAVRRAVESIVADLSRGSESSSAPFLAGRVDQIASRVVQEIVYDDYRLRELYDIVSWKKPPRTPGANQ